MKSQAVYIGVGGEGEVVGIERGALIICLEVSKVPRSSLDESGVRPEDASQLFVSPLYPAAKHLSASGKASQAAQHTCVAAVGRQVPASSSPSAT